MTQLGLRMAERSWRLLLAAALLALMALALIVALAMGMINIGNGEPPGAVIDQPGTLEDHLTPPDFSDFVPPPGYGTHDVPCPAGKECGP